MSSAAELNTRVEFFDYVPNSGPEPGEHEKKIVWSCWAEVYEPSIKDSESLSTSSTKHAVTIRIRNPLGEFTPKTNQYVAVLNPNFEGVRFNIKNVHPDVKTKKYIKVVGEAVSHGG